MEVEITSDIENKLLGRREVECIFRNASGGISRFAAVQSVSKKMKAISKKVYAISIDGGYGTRDVKGLFYIYGNEEDAKRDLPEYILKRNAAKAEAAEESAAQPEKPEEASEEEKAKSAKTEAKGESEVKSKESPSASEE